MNLTIEYLNELGGRFLAFAGPMLWQSGLLIAVVLALDLLLARRVRAAVRHALWLVVLVKLLLPPSLALPTGVAWWLVPAKPVVKAPMPKFEVVTTDETASAPRDFPAASVPVVLPPVRLARAGWVLLAVGGVSLGLLGWLVYRWGQVIRRVHRAQPAGDLAALVGGKTRWEEMSCRYRVKLVEEPMSPAVCGLFRPVILLPRMLAERLSADQLRAVLLHEVMHLRRGDIWTNCAQAVLQILYWWHPLVWAANGRMRRLREEAVDDAVMVALGGEGEVYAPTLLEVAKLAFRRSTLSLGLVGIMESKSALRQRIERLMALRTPRRAGVSVVSVLSILAFSAVAVPMGQGPAVMANDTGGGTPAAVSPGGRPPQVVIQGEIYRIAPVQLKGLVDGLAPVPVEVGMWPLARFTNGFLLEAFPGKVSGETGWLATPEQFGPFTNKLRDLGLELISRPRIQTTSGVGAQFFVGNDQGGIVIECRPMVKGGQIALVFTHEITVRAVGAGSTNRVGGSVVLPSHGAVIVSVPNDPEHRVMILAPEVVVDKVESGTAMTSEPRKRTMDKLGELRLSLVQFQGIPLGEVVRRLADEARQADPAQRGVDFQIKSMVVPAVTGPMVNIQTGLPANGTSATNPPTAAAVKITVDPVLSNARLQDVLDAVVKGASSPIHYEIGEDGNVVFADGAAAPLFTRTFRVNPAIFWANVQRALEIVPADSSTNQVGLLKLLFHQAGVNWETPAGKSVYYNDRLGYLFVKATTADLDLIENLVTMLVQDQPPAGYQVSVPGFVPGEGTNRSAIEGAVKKLRSLGASTAPADGRLINRTFVVLNASRLRSVTARMREGGLSGVEGQPISLVVKEFLAEMGVELDPSQGKSILYNEQAGLAHVRATEAELKIIEGALSVINAPDQPQIHIKARFLEVPTGALEEMKGVRWGSNGFPAEITGLLTAENARVAVQSLQKHAEVEVLGEPEVTFLAGRQVQMRATETKTVLTNISMVTVIRGHQTPMRAEAFERKTVFTNGDLVEVMEAPAEKNTGKAIAAQTNGSGTAAEVELVPESMKVECGPILDATAWILADGSTISLKTTALLTEFLGYAEVPTNSPGHLATRAETNGAGERVDVPLLWPAVQAREESARVNLYDGQTLVLVLDQARAKQISFSGKDDWRDANVAEFIRQTKQGWTQVLVFVTATMIDPAGNRVYAAEELPFARNGFPPQPKGE